ncbi:MAG: PaaI family thioesterase [Myxococcales bacterium]|jgi:uncharacterized protein (TIGR00369 family)|nr:PaaI family thioesterase [Myxococcales bacterium]MBL0193253.1 PaaI family thioesterase [Myxococcales bacterium]HQY60355.1 PaaI family thioesterase [Polyangiaceae bacterium]
MKLSELARVMEELIPFNRFLGIRCEEVREGYARLRIPFRAELVGDPMRPALHGGVLSTLADTAGGAAVWTGLRDARGRVSTIDLRIDYLRPARLADLVCEATVVRQGNRVGVADMRLYHPPAAPPAGEPEQAPDTIATGKGVYNVTLSRDQPRAR